MSKPLDLDAALRRILGQISAPTAAELVGIEESLGRVAAQECLARTDLPPFAASAMDGYAFAWRKKPASLRVVGTSLAGHPWRGSVGAGEAVRITTGAALPTGCDTVAIQERCTLQGDALHINSPVNCGDNVRRQGHDVRSGHVLAAQGRRLSAFDIGALAAAGVDALLVFARPRIAVFSSGDELQQPGTELAYGNIFDSNRYAVASLLRALPVTVADLGVLPDEDDAIAEALGRASGDCQLILTSGGVSVGDADLVKTTLDKLGRLDFWRLNLKPGRPVAFGRISEAFLLGLPGNPVSTIITYLLLAKPVIEALCGMAPRQPLVVRCQLKEQIRHKPGREEFQRGLLTTGSRQAQVRTTGDQSSNRMASFTTANCLIRIPKTSGDLAPGDIVEALPLQGLL